MKCSFCEKEVNDIKISQHERMCGKNPNRMGIKKGQKHKVVEAMAKKLEVIDTKKEAGTITQKEHDVSSHQTIEQAISPETTEEEPKEEKNPLVLIFIVILIIIITAIVFFKDEILGRFFPKGE